MAMRTYRVPPRRGIVQLSPLGIRQRPVAAKWGIYSGQRLAVQQFRRVLMRRSFVELYRGLDPRRVQAVLPYWTGRDS